MFDNIGDLPFIPIIKNTSLTDYYRLDLSIDSSQIPLEKQKDPEEMQLCISEILSSADKKVAYGGYLEKRLLYDRSEYFGTKEHKRNIHLGTDFWCDEGSIVLCPWKGTVHSFNNNQNYGDYGPTIIMKHQFRNLEFFALYGHLSEDSLIDLCVGDSYESGENLAKLGDFRENGNYAPHLHLQVILDIGSYKGDYPGVTAQEDLASFTKNGTDPKVLLGI